MSLIEDIKKPFNIIMLVIAIVAIVLSIIFYISSIKKKEPVYSISETQLQVYNSNLSTNNISVFDKSGNQIRNNIYVTTIAFWNNGQLGIDSSDVKKPINIMLTEGAKLIDYKISKSIHPEIAHYSLSKDTTDQNEKIILSWSYLDAGFGVEIQIIYSNSAESIINLDGYVVGTNIQEVQINKFSDFIIYMGVASVLGLMLAIILLGLFILSKRHLSEDKRRDVIRYYTYGILCFFAALVLLFINYFSGSKYPF